MFVTRKAWSQLPLEGRNLTPPLPGAILVVTRLPGANVQGLLLRRYTGPRLVDVKASEWPLGPIRADALMEAGAVWLDQLQRALAENYGLSSEIPWPAAP